MTASVTRVESETKPEGGTWTVTVWRWVGPNTLPLGSPPPVGDLPQDIANALQLWLDGPMNGQVPCAPCAMIGRTNRSVAFLQIVSGALRTPVCAQHAESAMQPDVAQAARVLQAVTS